MPGVVLSKDDTSYIKSLQNTAKFYNGKTYDYIDSQKMVNFTSDYQYVNNLINNIFNIQNSTSSTTPSDNFLQYSGYIDRTAVLSNNSAVNNISDTMLNYAKAVAGGIISSVQDSMAEGFKRTLDIAGLSVLKGAVDTLSSAIKNASAQFVNVLMDFSLSGQSKIADQYTVDKIAYDAIDGIFYTNQGSYLKINLEKYINGYDLLQGGFVFDNPEIQSILQNTYSSIDKIKGALDIAKAFNVLGVDYSQADSVVNWLLNIKNQLSKITCTNCVTRLADMIILLNSFKIDGIVPSNLLSNSALSDILIPLDSSNGAKELFAALENVDKFVPVVAFSSKQPVADPAIAAAILSSATATIWSNASTLNANDAMMFVLKSAKPLDNNGNLSASLSSRKQGEVPFTTGGKIDTSKLSSKYGWGMIDVDFAINSIKNALPSSTSSPPAKHFNFGNTAFVGSGVVGAAGFEGVRAAALGAVFTDAFGYTFAADLGDKSFISNGLGGFKNPYYNSVTYNTLGGYTNSYNGFFNSATSAAFGGFGVVGTGLSDSALSNMYSFGGYAGLNYKQGLYPDALANALANDFTAASFGSSKSSSSFARALNGDSLGSFVKDIYLGLASIGGGSFKGNAAAGQFIFGLDGFGSGFAGVATSGAAAAGLNAAASGFNSINIGTDTTFNNFAARFTNLSTSLNLSQLGAGSESYLASLGSLAGSSLSGSGLASNITSKDAANVKSFALGSSASSGLGFFSATSSSFINPLIYSSATSSTGYGFVSGANNANPLNANFASSASAFTGLGGLGSANIGFGGAYYNPASLINLNLNPLVRGFTEGGSGSLGTNPYLASQNSVKNFNLALGGVAVAYSQNAILQNSSSFANSMLQGFAGSSYRLGFKTGSKSALSLSASSLTPRTSAFAGLGGASGTSGNVSNSSGSSTLSGDNITTRLNTRGFNTRLLEASFTHSPNKNLAYDIKLGYMNESGSFLSNLVSGAFSVKGAKSFFTELLLHANLNQRLGISFDGSLGLGMTKVNAISGLLFDSFSNLTTSSAALRLTKHGLLLGSAGIDTTKAGNGGNGGNGGYLKAIKKAGFKAIDAVSLSVSAPYAISSGSAIVNGIGSNGSNASGANAGGTGKVANFGQSRVSLAAGMSSRQIDTGLSYRLALSSLSSAVYVDGGNGSLQGYKIKKHRAVTEAALSLSITHSQNYNHTKNLSTNTLALGIFIGG